jgi:hypothetical protein
MEHLFIERSGDREKIKELLIEFKLCSKQDIVSRYNRSVEVGILGVHAQGQMLIALRFAFITIFGKSPISIEENAIISLTDKIELIGGDWQYITLKTN